MRVSREQPDGNERVGETEPIRLVVIGDEAVVRSALCRLVAEEPGLDLVDELGPEDDVGPRIRRSRPDVALLAVLAAGMTAPEWIRSVIAGHRETRVLVLSNSVNLDAVFMVLQAGGAGLLCYDVPRERLIRAILEVARGRLALNDDQLDQVVLHLQAWRNGLPPQGLSRREQEILVQLARGSSTREVATALQLSPSTVDTHRGRILHKLGLRNISELTRFAVRQGWVEP